MFKFAEEENCFYFAVLLQKLIIYLFCSGFKVCDKSENRNTTANKIYPKAQERPALKYSKPSLNTEYTRTSVAPLGPPWVII